ncbi:MAG: large-conductance mechanosensitive channel protein MscL [Candidatus Caldatribacteriaceae bacterium]
MSKVIKEFRDFISRGNVIDLAVGFIIGSAFGTIVKSLVPDIIMPPIGLVLGKVDFSNLFVVLKEGNKPGPYYTIASAQEAGAVTLNYGLFVNSIVTFLIIALALFLLVKVINRMRREQEVAPSAPTTKECPFCFTTIPIRAVRCPNCTSELGK